MNPNHENFKSLKLWSTPSDWAGKPWKGWYVGLGRTRDSDLLEQSNFECFLEAVKEASAGRTVDDSANAYMHDWSETETVYVVHEGHWTCGWVEWVAIHESDEAACGAAEEILNALEEYGVVDDEHHLNLQMEKESEAWDNGVRQDLIDSIEDEELREWAEGPSNADDPHNLFGQAYREAMEETNTYPVEDGAGMYIDVNRIYGAFERHLRQLRWEHDAEVAGQMVMLL